MTREEMSEEEQQIWELHVERIEYRLSRVRKARTVAEKLQQFAKLTVWLEDAVEYWKVV